MSSAERRRARASAILAGALLLVCCALGYSRSACAVAAWLLSSGRARDVGTAIATVRAARAAVALDAGHAAALGGVPAAETGGLAVTPVRGAD